MSAFDYDTDNLKSGPSQPRSAEPPAPEKGPPPQQPTPAEPNLPPPPADVGAQQTPPGPLQQPPNNHIHQPPAYQHNNPPPPYQQQGYAGGQQQPYGAYQQQQVPYQQQQQLAYQQPQGPAYVQQQPAYQYAGSPYGVQTPLPNAGAQPAVGQKPPVKQFCGCNVHTAVEVFVLFVFFILLGNIGFWGWVYATSSSGSRSVAFLIVAGLLIVLIIGDMVNALAVKYSMWYRVSGVLWSVVDVLWLVGLVIWSTALRDECSNVHATMNGCTGLGLAILWGLNIPAIVCIFVYIIALFVASSSSRAPSTRLAPPLTA